MRVVHCECGLGNQMCYYAKYLALKKTHPNEDVYLETFLFDVPGIEKYMKMWNGYELETVFGIKANNVDSILLSPYQDILDKIADSNFGEIRWAASARIITKILAEENIIATESIDNRDYSIGTLKQIYIKHRNSPVGYLLRNVAWHMNGKDNPENYTRALCFDQNDKTEYYADLFDIIRPNSGIESIRQDLLETFKFPEITDEKNIQVLQIIHEVNSVSLHVRKSDCYKYNADCFKYGYFKRSVKFIKQNVDSPVFFVFSDDPSWVLSNLHTLGLSEKDQIVFVNWNVGKDSYIDLQLMSQCKNNISTNSTFGFWAAFLNQNKGKITCAPKGSFAVTNWF